MRKELDQLWGKYEIALYSLEVLNIKYKKECLANVSVIQNRLEKYKQTFNNSLTSEEVKSSSEDIFGRLANEKANGLEELRNAKYWIKQPPIPAPTIPVILVRAIPL